MRIEQYLSPYNKQVSRKKRGIKKFIADVIVT